VRFVQSYTSHRLKFLPSAHKKRQTRTAPAGSQFIFSSLTLGIETIVMEKVSSKIIEWMRLFSSYTGWGAANLVSWPRESRRARNFHATKGKIGVVIFEMVQQRALCVSWRVLWNECLGIWSASPKATCQMCSWNTPLHKQIDYQIALQKLKWTTTLTGEQPKVFKSKRSYRSKE
jgi:hypothetical protein